MGAELLDRYYAAFNRGDAVAMLDLVTDDVVHEPSQGNGRAGKGAFAAFLDHVNRCYCGSGDRRAEPSGRTHSADFCGFRLVSRDMV